MKRDIVWTTKFKKDYKLAIKRHLDIDPLDDIIRAKITKIWCPVSLSISKLSHRAILLGYTPAPDASS